LNGGGSAYPYLPVREKALSKDKIAGPTKVAADAPDTQRGATNGPDGKEAGHQSRDAAVFPFSARNHISAAETNPDDHEFIKFHYKPYAFKPTPRSRKSFGISQSSLYTTVA
jgi:hypothetical protein